MVANISLFLCRISYVQSFQALPRRWHYVLLRRLNASSTYMSHAHTTQDLMRLDLATMAADVEAIADKATKEANQEAALLVLQSTWDRIEFCVTANAEAETPLVKMSEEDLEVVGV